MARLTRNDLLKTIDFLHGLYANRPKEAFTDHLLSNLPALFHFDLAASTEGTLSESPTISFNVFPHSFPILRNGIDIYKEALLRDGDAVSSFWDFEGFDIPVRFLDAAPKSFWEKSFRYNEFDLPQKTPHMLGLSVEYDLPSFWTLSLHRGGRDFTQHDVAHMQLLRPHLQQALLNSRLVTAMEQGLQTYADTVHSLPQAIVALGPSRKIAWATPRGTSLAKKYTGGRTEAGDVLASPFREWVQQQDALLDDPDTAPTEQVPLLLEGGGYRLTVRLIRQNDFRLLFFEEEPEEVPIDRLQAFGLTPRECEVMRWVIAGKTNPEIARILGVSVVTVEKHLGSVYQKLNVENRTAAVTTAMELMKQNNGVE